MLPVRSPEGRFHHSGQTAIYTSLSVEGCGVAIKRYLTSEGAPRHIVPLKVELESVVDIRGQSEAAVVWQDFRAIGQPAPTWDHSDHARADGAQGLMYSSRSRPDLTHLVLFDASPDRLHIAGSPIPFP
ncbi:RES family NAD+ phosphorylase [Aliiroseovarius sp. M344]|nr:RES family NAD+ phosphorylase [Aliiroseovarius sp. M344]